MCWLDYHNSINYIVTTWHFGYETSLYIFENITEFVMHV